MLMVLKSNYQEVEGSKIRGVRNSAARCTRRQNLILILASILKILASISKILASILKILASIFNILILFLKFHELNLYFIDIWKILILTWKILILESFLNSGVIFNDSWFLFGIPESILGQVYEILLSCEPLGEMVQFFYKSQCVNSIIRIRFYGKRSYLVFIIKIASCSLFEIKPY